MLQALIARFERLIDPFKPYEETTPPSDVWAFYLTFLRQVWPVFAAVLVAGFLVAVTEVQLFRFISNIVDILSKTKPDQLWPRYGGAFLWMFATVGIARPVFSLLHDLLLFQAVAPGFSNMIRWQNHRHVLRQSISFFANDYAGRIASKVIETGPALRQSLVTVCDALWFVLLYFVSALVLFFQADAWLVVPLIVWVLIYVVLLRYFVPRLAQKSEIMSEVRSTLVGRVVDSYTNIQTVKLFAHADREDDYVRDCLADHTRKFRDQQAVITRMTTSINLVNCTLLIVIASLSVYLWTKGALSVGAIALAGGLAVRIINMSGWIMWEVTGIFENIGAVQNGVATIAKPHTVLDAPDAKALSVPAGEVRFEGVRFAYGADLKPGGKGALDGVDLVLKPGEKVGLIGRSGAGKSTLVNVFLRLYDLSAGRILIDGQDIRQVDQESLRAAIGMVTQDTSLLHRAIRDNIAYGRPDASLDEVITAAQKARAHDFIQHLSDNSGRTAYDAHVGERGVKLSGGQRQRIAIARVLLKNAPILVLDEATSALDSEVEAAIQESLIDLMEGKTVIAIAHRLSTIARMDRLIVMDAGRIVETGTHAQLIASGGLYAQLWARQTGGFLAEDLQALA